MPTTGGGWFIPRRTQSHLLPQSWFPVQKAASPQRTSLMIQLDFQPRQALRMRASTSYRKAPAKLLPHGNFPTTQHDPTKRTTVPQPLCSACLKTCGQLSHLMVERLRGDLGREVHKHIHTITQKPQKRHLLEGHWSTCPDKGNHQLNSHSHSRHLKQLHSFKCHKITLLSLHKYLGTE